MSLYEPDFKEFRGRQALAPVRRQLVSYSGAACGAYLYATVAGRPGTPLTRLWCAYLETPSGFRLLEATAQQMEQGEAQAWFAELLSAQTQPLEGDPGPARHEREVLELLSRNWPSTMNLARRSVAGLAVVTAFDRLCRLSVLHLRANPMAPDAFELLRAELPGLTRAEVRFTAAATVLGDAAMSLQDGVHDLAAVLLASMAPGQSLPISATLARELGEGIAHLQRTDSLAPPRYTATDLVDQLVPVSLRQDLIAQLS